MTTQPTTSGWTPRGLLDDLKVQVTLDPDDMTRLKLGGPKPPDTVLADLATHKPEILLRLLLRKWFDWTALEADGTPCLLGEKASALLHAEWRAAQALGSERAEAVRQDEYRLFFQKTNRCPTCGERGRAPSDDVELDHPHHRPRGGRVIEKPAAGAAPPVAPGAVGHKGN